MQRRFFSNKQQTNSTFLISGDPSLPRGNPFHLESFGITAKPSLYRQAPS